MNWEVWLVLAAIGAGAYVIGLIGYRVSLNLKGLKSEVDKAESLIAEAKAFEQLEPAPAKANNADDLAEVLLNRRRIQKEKEERHQSRQRRLVQRISEIEIDKR